MSGPVVQFSLSADPIDPSALAASLQDSRAGACVTFDGWVRDHNDGREVSHLEYQAYPALVEKTGRRILAEEAAKHGLYRATAVHRSGPLAIGESAVWVGVASAHRGDAFEGARAIMDRLKYELPIWKKETYADGRVEWVGPDNKSAETGKPKDGIPEWDAALEAIYLSGGHDFRGRHGLGREHHAIVLVPVVECVAGMGLKGDRYFGFKDDFKGQVTFFSAETVDAVAREFSLPEPDASLFRRNLIVRGVTLADWVGKRFRFQGIVFEGSEECRPCYWMDEAIAPGAEEFLKRDFRGGLRARVVGDGTLRVGA